MKDRAKIIELLQNYNIFLSNHGYLDSDVNSFFIDAFLDWADIKPTKPRFTPPTVEEIKAYCTERKNKVDPEQFYDFYTSKGWLVGKTKMKDWEASVRTWERSTNTSPVNNFNKDSVTSTHQKPTGAIERIEKSYTDIANETPQERNKRLAYSRAIQIRFGNKPHTERYSLDDTVNMILKGELK